MWAPWVASVYGVKPWEMDFLTPKEWADMVRERERMVAGS